MKIFIASDHAGFEMKEALKGWLSENGHEIRDFGATVYDKDDDYPDFIAPLAVELGGNSEAFAILVGKSGQGEAIAANRHQGVRAMVYNQDNLQVVKLAREHNDANAISIGTAFVTIDQAQQAITTFLETPFSKDERHMRRLGKLNEPAVYTFGAE